MGMALSGAAWRSAGRIQKMRRCIFMLFPGSVAMGRSLLKCLDGRLKVVQISDYRKGFSPILFGRGPAVLCMAFYFSFMRLHNTWNG
jgi:hypothetical protein